MLVYTHLKNIKVLLLYNVILDPLLANVILLLRQEQYLRGGRVCYMTLSVI